MRYRGVAPDGRHVARTRLVDAGTCGLAAHALRLAGAGPA